MAYKDQDPALEHLENLQEEAVLRTLRHVLAELRKQGNDICICNRCYTDMAALALNALPPRYVADRFNLFPQRSREAVATQEQVMKAVRDAVGRVSSFPRHD